MKNPSNRLLQQPRSAEQGMTSEIHLCTFKHNLYVSLPNSPNLRRDTWMPELRCWLNIVSSSAVYSMYDTVKLYVTQAVTTVSTSLSLLPLPPSLTPTSSLSAKDRLKRTPSNNYYLQKWSWSCGRRSTPGHTLGKCLDCPLKPPV